MASVALSTGARSAPQSQPLLGRTRSDLSSLVRSLGFKEKDGSRLFDALVQHSPRELSDLRGFISRDLRNSLNSAGFTDIGRSSSIADDTTASDGTRKLLLSLNDGSSVECVGIPSTIRRHSRGQYITACLSTMAGCPLKCSFCATGSLGFGRVLRSNEIIDQVLTLQERTNLPVAGVTWMGQGEPLLALSNVERATDALAEGLRIGRKRMTLSTVGIPGRIKRLAHKHLGCTLTVSLHASNQALREQIIPSAKSYLLDAMFEELKEYELITGRPPCWEYLLLGDGFNDTDEHAHELAELLHSWKLPYHTNLIEWNPVPGMPFSGPTRDRTMSFQRILRKNGIPATIRRSAGPDEAAACGQLKNTVAR